MELRRHPSNEMRRHPSEHSNMSGQSQSILRRPTEEHSSGGGCLRNRGRIASKKNLYRGQSSCDLMRTEIPRPTGAGNAHFDLSKISKRPSITSFSALPRGASSSAMSMKNASFEHLLINSRHAQSQIIGLTAKRGNSKVGDSSNLEFDHIVSKRITGDKSRKRMHAATTLLEKSPFRIELDRCKSELCKAKLLYGISHPNIAKPLTIIGLLYQHMVVDDEMALSYHTHALNILKIAAEKSPKQYSRDMGVILVDIGNIRRRRAENVMAREKYSEALRLFRIAGLPRTHPQVYAATTGIYSIDGR